MPTSNLDPIPLVIMTVKKCKPKTVLDIGCGFGKYGFLLREQLDIAEEQKRSNLLDYSINRSSWQTQIDAVEVYKNYICDIQRYIYNNIFIGNIVHELGKLNNYDVILLMDVIEHFDKKEGKEILDKLFGKVNKLLVVTTPPFEYIQNNICGNELERHRSVWNPNDFRKYKNKKITNINNQTLCIFISKEPKDISLANLKAKVSLSDMIKNLFCNILGDKWGTEVIEWIRRIKRLKKRV